MTSEYHRLANALEGLLRAQRILTIKNHADSILGVLADLEEEASKDPNITEAFLDCLGEAMEANRALITKLETLDIC